MESKRIGFFLFRNRRRKLFFHLSMTIEMFDRAHRLSHRRLKKPIEQVVWSRMPMVIGRQANWRDICSNQVIDKFVRDRSKESNFFSLFFYDEYRRRKRVAEYLILSLIIFIKTRDSTDSLIRRFLPI